LVAFEETIVPLPIYPWEAVYAHLSVVRDAFVSLGLPVRVRPVEALPGSPGTILAIGATPDWPCDYAPVSSISSPGLSYAIKCCVMGIKDPRIIDSWKAAENILTKVFGEVKFVEEIPYVR
jgi:hypothetical protein